MSIQSKEFSIDLISNASMKIYPNNTLSRFANKLPNPIYLEGDWYVGVREIFYPLTYVKELKTVTFCLYYKSYDLKVTSAGKMMSIKYAEDAPVNQIIDEINTNLEKLLTEDQIVLRDPKSENSVECPKFESREGKIILNRGASPFGMIIPFFKENEFLISFGFDPTKYKSDLLEVLYGKQFIIEPIYQPLIGTKSHLLFVYTDIIHEHFVGDTKSRLLKVVPLSRGAYKDIGYMYANTPFYYQVRVKDLSTISVLLADENGNAIKFNDGRTHISLHFIRKDVV